MKEQLHTIPVNEAFDAGDECLFCHLERRAEQSTLRYVAGPGASYMEPDVRAETDKTGFCREHTKKLYDYGNALGAALMLQTHFAGLLERYDEETVNFTPAGKKNIFGKRKGPDGTPFGRHLVELSDKCFICDRVDYHMDRYFHTFFVLLKDAEFREKVLDGKGFCLRHFGQMLEAAEKYLPNDAYDWFYAEIFKLEKAHLIRVKEDLDWLIAKYDYRNAGADWKNSRDALQRTMQKLEGIYPADKPYQKD